MHQRRKLIDWSPFVPNRFVVASSDLRLYELKQTPVFQDGNEVNDDKTAINLLSVNSEVQQVKCLTWSPNSQDKNLLAVGLLTGKVLLSTFSSVNLISKEFVPKHQRPCNCLAWNPIYTNLLAAGLDKIRSDHSILVWDLEYTQQTSASNQINMGSHINSSGRLGMGGSYQNFARTQPFDTPHTILQSTDHTFHTSLIEAAETFTKPQVELAMSEATVSLSWLPASPSCLAAGTSVKWLRIYDLRSSSSISSVSHGVSPNISSPSSSNTTTFSSTASVPPPSMSNSTSSNAQILSTLTGGQYSIPRSVVAHNKGVYGVRFDPFSPERFLTFSDDGVVKVWDLRKLTDPFYSINTGSKSLTQVEWCPTRSGILASISREEDIIKFWDIKDLRLASYSSSANSGTASSISSVGLSVSSTNISGQIQGHNALSSGTGIASSSANVTALPPGLTSVSSGASQPYGSGYLSSASGMSSGSSSQSNLSSVAPVLTIVEPTPQDNTPVSTRLITKPFRTHSCLEPVSSMSWGIVVREGGKNEEGGKPSQVSIGGITHDNFIINQQENENRSLTGVSASGRSGSNTRQNRGVGGTVSGAVGVGGSFEGVGSNRLLTVSNNGLIEVVSLKEPIAISFSPSGHLSFATMKKLHEIPPWGTDSNEVDSSNVNLAQSLNNLELLGFGKEDVSSQIQRLALMGYQMDIKKNKKIAQKHHNPECVALWKWMINCREFIQAKTAKFPGLNSILWANKQSSVTEKSLLPHSSSTPELSSNSNHSSTTSLNNSGTSNNNSSFSNTTTSSNSSMPTSPNSSHITNTYSPLNPFNPSLPPPYTSMNLNPNQNQMFQSPSSNINNNSSSSSSNSSSSSSSSSNPNNPSLNQSMHTNLNNNNTTQNNSFSVPVYSSTQRRVSMILCGWSPTTLEDTLVKLEKKGQFERSAALAVFNLDIRRAIKALTISVTENPQIKIDPIQEANMRLVAMSLAGYADNSRRVAAANSAGVQSPSTQSLWKSTYWSVKEYLKNSYLRFCFDFLVAEPKFFRALVEANNDIFLWDRIAFACRFLPDADLMSYIESLTQRAIKSGNLEGIVLTGLTLKGVDLFEKYVDKTADIQTAALVLSHVVPRKFRDSRVIVWMEAYRNLLDVWGLWHIRAELDNERLVEPEPEPSQVYARCNFCQQSLALSMIAAGKNVTQNPYAVSRSAKSTKTKVNSCPSCNKPLPRCALCHLPLGCSIRKTEQGTNFDDWFTWCQTCKHGGHAGHISDWFKNYSQCPVSDCDCRCASL